MGAGRRTPGVSTTRQATPAAGAAAPGPERGRRARAVLGGLAGLLAAAVALGGAELAAGLVGPLSSPVVAVGDAAITLTPEAVKQFAIRQFGSQDKLALVAGVLAVVAASAVAVGVLALRRRTAAAAGIALFGVVGAVAALTRPTGRLVDGIPSVVGAVAGVLALLALTVPLGVPRPEAPSRDAPPRADADAAVLGRLRQVLAAGDRTVLDRRRFFVTGGVALGVAVVAGGGGRLLQRRFDVATERARLALPRPASPAPPLPAGADLSRAGARPDPAGHAQPRTSTGSTRRSPCRRSAGRLPAGASGHGDPPAELHLRRPAGPADVIERDITLTCVSNEVGGTLRRQRPLARRPARRAAATRSASGPGPTSWSAARSTG